MTVKIDMDMPESCHKCPFSSFFSLWSGRKICLLELGIQQYKAVVLQEPFEAWVTQPEVKEGEKLPNCPLQEVKKVKKNKWSEGYDAGMKRAYEQMLEAKENSVKE